MIIFPLLILGFINSVICLRAQAEVESFLTAMDTMLRGKPAAAEVPEAEASSTTHETI